MRARILALRRLCANPQYTIIRRGSRGAEEECDAHMNELPIPCGAWDPWYRDKQAFYNKVLLFGAGWFIFSAAMMFYTNSIYLNFSPPIQPGPPSDMVEECDDSDTAG